MPHRRKLTDAQIEEMCEKREKGWGYERLAERFGVSQGAIHYQCLKNAAVSPRQRRRPVPTEPSSFVAGDGRTQRRFTIADDERLLELEASGLSYQKIGRQMGRAYTSVRIRLLTLALRDDIPEPAE